MSSTNVGNKVGLDVYIIGGGGGGGGGGGDASAANQTTQIASADLTNTRLGSVTETAPADDTASSGLNGRLQRIAQRITGLIALLPASLGQKTAADSLAVTMASDQSRMLTEPLGRPTVARQQAATATSANVVLTVGVTRISIFCRNADARYALGSSSQTANNATSHFIAAGERIDINVPATPNIAFIRAALSTSDATIEITELSA
jgi:hypothetical protein